METADALAEVPPDGGAPRITKTGARPHDASAAADGTIYVGDEFGSAVSVLRDGKLVDTVGVDVQPGGVAVVGDYVAVVSVRAYTLDLIDRRTLRRVGGTERRLRAVARGRRCARARLRGRHARRRDQRLRDAPAAALHRPREPRRARRTGWRSTRPATACGSRSPPATGSPRCRSQTNKRAAHAPDRPPAQQRRRRPAHRPRARRLAQRRHAAADQPVSTVPSSIVAGPSTFTLPRATTSAPNVTSPSTSKRSASFSDGGPFGKRASKSRMQLVVVGVQRDDRDAPRGRAPRARRRSAGRRPSAARAGRRSS